MFGGYDRLHSLSFDTENGTYYQASPLLFTNGWVDKTADPYAYNWYKVKVLDTGGYLSEFSEPILVRHFSYIPTMTTVLPGLSGPETEAEPKPETEPETETEVPGISKPSITFSGNKFKSDQGEEFKAAYELSGSEPITVTIKATNTAGLAVGGFSVDQNARLVKASSNLGAGTYNVTVTATNAAGEDSNPYADCAGKTGHHSAQNHF